MGWHTVLTAQEQWLDAPDWEDREILDDLLDAAKDAVIAYAPELEADAPIPAGYRIAQLMQARSIWNATRQGEGDNIGPEGFAVRVYPLDKNIRQLLRPKTVIGGMF